MYANNNIDIPYMIYQTHKGDDDLIIEKMEKLIKRGINIRSKNLVSRICETNNIKLLTYLIGIKYKFDKLPIYICALEGHMQLLSILLQYQEYDLDWKDLENKLIENGNQNIIDFLKNENYI
jgi:hypothetical protein